MPSRPSVSMLCQVSGRPAIQLQLWNYLKHCIDSSLSYETFKLWWSRKKSCHLSHAVWEGSNRAVAVQLTPQTSLLMTLDISQGQALEVRLMHFKSLRRLVCCSQLFYLCSWKVLLTKISLLRLALYESLQQGRRRSLIPSEYLFASWWLSRMNRLWSDQSLAQAEWGEGRRYC